MPSSDCFLRGVAAQVQRIINQRHAAAGPLVGSGARRLCAHLDGAAGAATRACPIHRPKNSEGVDLSRWADPGAAPWTHRLARQKITG
jgi:hypothetical protein